MPGGWPLPTSWSPRGNEPKQPYKTFKTHCRIYKFRDGAMVTVGNIFNRISQMRVMAEDVTKNSGDIENYSKEFVELQLQLDQINNQKFNALSLFAINGAPPGNNGTKGIVTYQKTDGTSGTYQKFGRVLQVDPTSSGETVSINVINLEYVVSYDALDPTKVQVNAAGYADRITDFSVSLMMEVVEKIADARAENGAEQNRLLQTIDLLQTNMTNIEAAFGRIMDTDMALESTRFARHNVLVQASAAMTAQANQLTNVALSLIG